MITWLTGILAKRVGERFAPLAAWGIVGLLAFLAAGFIVWKIYDRGYDSGTADANAKWNVKVDKIVERRVKLAIEAANEDDTIREGGEAAIEGRREEIDNATEGLPDQDLSARQRARACAELRRQGRDCRH